jgi:hypothetical protein
MKAAKLKKKWTGWCRLHAESALKRTTDVGDDWDPGARYDVDVYWAMTDRRMDPDNISAGIKFILDGFQPKILANDGWRNVRSIMHMFGVENQPCVVVTLKEVTVAEPWIKKK